MYDLWNGMLMEAVFPLFPGEEMEMVDAKKVYYFFIIDLS